MSYRTPEEFIADSIEEYRQLHGKVIMKSPCYICGPMTGLPNFNYDFFNEAARALRNMGLKVYNPAESFGGDQTRPRSDYLRKAVRMVSRSNSIVLLPGWGDSEGARLEVSIGEVLGLNFYEVGTEITFRRAGLTERKAPAEARAFHQVRKV